MIEETVYADVPWDPGQAYPRVRVGGILLRRAGYRFLQKNDPLALLNARPAMPGEYVVRIMGYLTPREAQEVARRSEWRGMPYMSAHIIVRSGLDLLHFVGRVEADSLRLNFVSPGEEVLVGVIIETQYGQPATLIRARS
jgi:hypothetical protein